MPVPKCPKPSYCWYIIKQQYSPNWYPPDWNQLSLEQQELWNQFEQFMSGSWDDLTGEQVLTQLNALDTMGLSPLKLQFKAVLEADHPDLVQANLAAFNVVEAGERYDLLGSVQDGFQRVLTETFQLADATPALPASVLINQASMRAVDLIRPEIERLVTARLAMPRTE